MSDIDSDKDHMRIVLVASKQMVIMRLSVEEWVRMGVLPRTQALGSLCSVFFLLLGISKLEAGEL